MPGGVATRTGLSPHLSPMRALVACRPRVASPLTRGRASHPPRAPCSASGRLRRRSKKPLRWQKFSPRWRWRNAILFLFGRQALSRNRFPLFSWSPPKGSRCRRNPQPGAAPQAAPSAGAALRTAARAGRRPLPTRWPRRWRSTAVWRPSTAWKTAFSRSPARCRAASPFRPASASRIRPCSTPSRRAAPRSTCSPSTPAATFPRRSTRWKPARTATASISASCFPMRARSRSSSPATASTASASPSRTARPAATSARCAR